MVPANFDFWLAVDASCVITEPVLPPISGRFGATRAAGGGLPRSRETTLPGDTMRRSPVDLRARNAALFC